MGVRQVLVSFRSLNQLSYQVHYLKVNISHDQPLLNEFLRKKLNPLQVNLVGCKDIPFKTEPKYKPIFAVCRFVDEKSFRTRLMPQQPFCKWQHCHVFLAGRTDPVVFKELLASKTVRVRANALELYSRSNFTTVMST